MRLSYEHAVEYLKCEIMQWLEDHKPEPMPPAPKSKLLWYIPSIQGVTVPEAIAYPFSLVNEEFKHNPYGIGARWFWLVMAAAFTFWFGHIAVGTVESAFEAFAPNKRYPIAKGLLPVLKGWLSGLPVVWMIIAFCFPALIANLEDQLRAVGVHVVDF